MPNGLNFRICLICWFLKVTKLLFIELSIREVQWVQEVQGFQGNINSRMI